MKGCLKVLFPPSFADYFDRMLLRLAKTCVGLQKMATFLSQTRPPGFNQSLQAGDSAYLWSIFRVYWANH
jgi:hypothetical protein